MPFTNIKTEDDEDSPIPPAERAAAASLALGVILMAVGVGTLLSVSAHPIHAV